MTMDIATKALGIGYHTDSLNKPLKAGRKDEEKEESKFSSRIEKELKTVQPVVNVEINLIKNYMIKKEEGTKKIEYREAGKFVDISA